MLTNPGGPGAASLWIAQQAADIFPATVLETALIGRHPHLSRWQWESAADVERARTALAAFGLAGLDARDARTLSGGERRRLALAALLAPGVEDASLHVLPDGPHKTKLDYRPGVAQDVAMKVRGNPSNPGPVVPRRF